MQSTSAEDLQALSKEQLVERLVSTQSEVGVC